MKLVCVFTTSGQPATGLSPVIDGWTLAGTQVITAQAMTEIAGGFYYFDFSGYDFSQDYVFRGYAASLANGEEYVYLSNDADSQNGQGIIKQILGLVQGNMKTTNTTYDANGRLLTANLYTYPTQADVSAGTNVLHSYAITATYDVATGNLQTYSCKEV